MNPRTLLCKQFWTPKQHLDFSEIKFVQKKLPLYNQILDNLTEKIDSTLADKDNQAKNITIDLIQRVSQLMGVHSEMRQN